MSTASTVPDIWEATASDAEGGSYERPAPGTYPAVLVALIDLGTHPRIVKDNKTGQEKTIRQRKLFFVFELTGEFDSKGESFLVAQDYTWSLHKQSKLRPMIEGWQGKGMAADEKFSVISLLGKECCLSISESVSSGGKKFTEISGVGPVMKGLVVPKPFRELFAFNVATLGSAKDDIPIPEWVPRIYGREVRDDIKKCDEYAALAPF